MKVAMTFWRWRKSTFKFTTYVVWRDVNAECNDAVNSQMTSNDTRFNRPTAERTVGLYNNTNSKWHLFVSSFLRRWNGMESRGMEWGDHCLLLGIRPKRPCPLRGTLRQLWRKTYVTNLKKSEGTKMEIKKERCKVFHLAEYGGTTGVQLHYKKWWLNEASYRLLARILHRLPIPLNVAQ